MFIRQNCSRGWVVWFEIFAVLMPAGRRTVRRVVVCVNQRRGRRYGVAVDGRRRFPDAQGIERRKMHDDDVPKHEDAPAPAPANKCHVAALLHHIRSTARRCITLTELAFLCPQPTSRALSPLSPLSPHSHPSPLFLPRPVLLATTLRQAAVERSQGRSVTAVIALLKVGALPIELVLCKLVCPFMRVNA